MNIDDELAKLRKLREDGTITEEQYDRAVAELEADRAEHARRARDDSEDDDFDRPERRPRRRRDDDEPLSPRQRRKKVREWAMFLHLSLLLGYATFLGGILAPILMWQSKKDEWPDIDEHGKNAVNWMISHLIYMTVSGVLCFVFVGIPFFVAFAVLGVVFPIIAGMKANEGRVWKYPLAIPFFS